MPTGCGANSAAALVSYSLSSAPISIADPSRDVPSKVSFGIHGEMPGDGAQFPSVPAPIAGLVERRWKLPTHALFEYCTTRLVTVAEERFVPCELGVTPFGSSQPP